MNPAKPSLHLAPLVIHPFIFVRVKTRIEKIVLAEIAHLEACGNYTKLYLANRSVMVHLSLKQMEEFLPSEVFCRIHRAFVISLLWLQAFDTHFAYGPTGRVPIARSFRLKLAGCAMILGDKPTARFFAAPEY